MSEPQSLSWFGARPFLEVLTDLRDLGRQRREIAPDDPVVDLAKRAHAAIQWWEAEQAGALGTAEVWLEKVYPAVDALDDPQAVHNTVDEDVSAEVKDG